MARVRTDHPRTPLLRLMEWYSRRRYGAVLQPALVAVNNKKVLRTYVRTELGAARWHALDPELKALAVFKAASVLGCSWCLDFGFWESWSRGIATEKLEAVAHYESSDLFSPLEQRVLRFAEAMTRTPVEVSDDLVAELRRDLSDAEIVELTFMVALENHRSRVNLAMGLTSQGFKEFCELTHG